MLAIVNSYINSLVNALYPKICIGCGNTLLSKEEYLCIGCEMDLPLSYYWENPDNRLAMRFTGRVPLDNVTSLLLFKKGSIVQEIVHHIKYRGRKDAAVHFGKMLGNQLKKTDSTIHKADLIIPVPLHANRLKTRGYNQCDYFAQGLAESLQIPWSAKVLIRPADNISQTKKRKLDRWGNVAEIFELADTSAIENKHILLVDDVITTGATAEACITSLLQAQNVKVSFAAIATAIY